MGVRQANEFPGLAGVDRFIHSVSADDVAADASFASTYIDRVWIGLGNGQRANRRRCVLLLVKERPPIEAAIGGLPNAPGHTAKIINVVLADDAGNGEHASAAKGPDKDRKSTRLNSSHQIISYAVFCLKKKKKKPLYRTNNCARHDARLRRDHRER